MDLGGERGDHRRRLDLSEDGLVIRGLARAFCPLILTFGGSNVSSGVGQEGISRSQWIQVAFALLSGAFCAALAALRQDRRLILGLCLPKHEINDRFGLSVRQIVKMTTDLGLPFAKS